ncbi:MAG TPA: hypothetical protein VGF24_18605 [Vicinamibacterales bacterium]
MVSSRDNSRLVRRLLMLVNVWIVGCAAVAASEFWESKPFTQWSDKEVEKVLTDSPWAVLMAVPLPNRGPVPTADSGGGERGGGGRGGGGAEGFGPGPQRVRLTISWRSALPVKEAAARQQAGKNGTITDETKAALEHDENLYVIGIQGLPPQYLRPGPNNTIQAFLRREGKGAIAATQGSTQMTRGGALLLVGFPRTDPITLSDGDVEFDVKMGEFSFKKKFKLKDLVFDGKLAL